MLLTLKILLPLLPLLLLVLVLLFPQGIAGYAQRWVSRTGSGARIGGVP